jgi:hypothetical protein
MDRGGLVAASNRLLPMHEGAACSSCGVVQPLKELPTAVAESSSRRRTLLLSHAGTKDERCEKKSSGKNGFTADVAHLNLESRIFLASLLERVKILSRYSIL